MALNCPDSCYHKWRLKKTLCLHNFISEIDYGVLSCMFLIVKVYRYIFSIPMVNILHSHRLSNYFNKIISAFDY